MLRFASRVGYRPLSLALVALGTLAACADGSAPTAPERSSELLAPREAAMSAEANMTLATLRRVTGRYHELQAALDDDFILLHECESIEGEGPVGTVYFNPGRVDGTIDPQFPEALIYEPSANGKPRLVGVEFAVPNVGQPAPQFLGATFQSEEDIGVYALHVWVWRPNPEGMFAETNSRVSCGVE